jgi:arginase
MLKSFLFVKAKSRLGLINPPIREVNHNIGVEEGPEYILSSEFMNQFLNKEEILYKFSDPENVEIKTYYKVIAKEFEQFIKLISNKFDHSKTLVTIGGDHSISLGSLTAVLKVFDPSKTGVIMIDSHGDIHQPSTSPSGNFHGMWLRTILNKFEIETIDILVQQKLPNENLFYIGNLDIESAEKEYMKENGIDNFNQKHLNSARFLKKLDLFLTKMDHIHLSLDTDAFSHVFAPATGIMIKNGLAPVDVFPILRKLSLAKSLSVDLVEVNPKRNGSGQTIKLAQDLLNALLTA